jgi:hypothetical protein
MVRITLATRVGARLVVSKLLGFENRLRGELVFLSFVGKSRLRRADASGKFFAELELKWQTRF